MCCYESIVNQIIQKVIKEMHQTATATQREWARVNILDAQVFEDVKTVSLSVTSEAVKREILQGINSAAVLSSVMLSYPGYRLEVTVKPPLNLSVLQVINAES